MADLLATVTKEVFMAWFYNNGRSKAKAYGDLNSRLNSRRTNWQGGFKERKFFNGPSGVNPPVARSQRQAEL